MHLKSNLSKYFIFLVIIYSNLTISAQPGKERLIIKATETAEFIVEGEIIKSESFWDSKQLNIYTTYTLEVSNTLKGELSDKINILVKGGKVDSTWQMVSTSIRLNVGDKGTFLLNKFSSTTISPTKQNWFIIANGNNGVLGLESKSLKTINRNHEINKQKSALATHKIDSISPKIVTAGTGTLLNIYGSGFGEKLDTSRVWFTFSDMTHHIYSNDVLNYKSWNDNLIQIYVPHKAATGQIAIVINDEKVFSEDSLTVRYACTTSIREKPVNLINLDSKGGYTWDLHTNLSSFPGSKELIQESINDWICATSVPWKIGNETNLEPARDGKCTIAFGKIDYSTTAMGETSIRATSHPSSGDSSWVLKEVDILFAEDKEYCFTGNCQNSGKYDFKTIILHELAHAHLIDHVNDENDLMHCDLDEGIIQSIGETNIECGEYIINLSTTLQHPEFKTIAPYEFTQPVIAVNGDVLTSEYEFQNYQWCDRDGEIPNANNQTYTINKSGEYYLIASNEFGCSQVSESVTVVSTGNNEIKNHNEVLIYPNPANDKLNIKFKPNTFTEVFITNTYGQKVYRSLVEPSSNQKVINLEKLSSGIYFVRCSNFEKAITKKVVVRPMAL